MLIQRSSWSAFGGEILSLNSTYLAFVHVDILVIVQGVPSRNDIGNAKYLRRAIVPLHGLTFSFGFVVFATNMHAFMGKQIQAREFVLVCSVGMIKIVHERTAPRVLEDDLPRFWRGVAGRKVLRVKEHVEDRVAVNFGAVKVGQLC